MANGCEDEEGFAGNLREKLALAVRDIEWSYAIFWSISSLQPGVLEWGDGYYNGDIKTRKTVLATEISADQLGLQRTEHLRELYESLLAGESKIHSAALSPEDLTDTEWLPGRTLAKNQTIWLCNAHQADSKIFSRSLLAKSASIQTAVCFPYLGGVIELGATDLVSEDLNLIHYIRTSYLDILNTVGSKVPTYVSCNDKNDPVPPVGCEDNNINSPDQEEADSFMVEGVNGEASQLQNWKLVDDGISYCVHNSTNSSDCISDNYENPERMSTLSDVERKLNMRTEQGVVDVHYQSILSNVLKGSHQLILGPYVRSIDRESSFITWKKEIPPNIIQMSSTGTPQRLLKKVLLEVMRDNRKENGLYRPEADETDRSRVVSERRRREKINERLVILASLIPTSGKVDKITILDETIEYLKGLERRVREVESQKERLELEASIRGESCDDTERTSDNCGANRVDKGKNSMPHKRKACGMEENLRGKNKGHVKNDSAHNVTVSMNDEDVTVEMKCPWSEDMLIKIIQALNNLHLDCHGIQSSNSDGILSVTIKAKMEGKATSISLIRQALQKLTGAS